MRQLRKCGLFVIDNQVFVFLNKIFNEIKIAISFAKILIIYLTN